jgi:multiple sugar transport system ATP-binding protein
VPAEVSLLEPLGAETLATLKVGAAEMVARCPASFREPPGTRLSVHLNPRHMHLFDAASGNAI